MERPRVPYAFAQAVDESGHVNVCVVAGVHQANEEAGNPHVPNVKTFYALRHVFETEAGDCVDQVAVNYAMGHDDGSMASVYREGVKDHRLEAVADHVHAWLFEGR